MKMKQKPDLLRRLVDEASQEVEIRRLAMPEAHLEQLARALPLPTSFAAALRRPPGLAVIAEMKARTPTMGRLVEDYRPGWLAAQYQAGGAAAISVLSQETSFGGRPEHLAEAGAVSTLPLLRKDFVVTEHQVLEARAYGAAAVLLIVAALEPAQLRDLLDLTWRLGMEALVETHEEAEIETALSAGSRVLGVNHRDLASFRVDLGLTERLRPLVPPEVVYVAESGVRGSTDARRLREAGADAILVGENLMRSADPAAAIRELLLA